MQSAQNVNGSCQKADTTTPGQGAITFPDGTIVPYSFGFDFSGTEGEFTYIGEQSGTGHGHGSFLTMRTPPDVALQCGPSDDGIDEAPMDFALITDSPLVSRRQRLRLFVWPRRVETGQRTSFAFQVTTLDRRSAVPGATVLFAGQRAVTGQTGVVRMVATLRRSGLRRAHATKPGFDSARKSVRARK